MCCQLQIMANVLGMRFMYHWDKLNLSAIYLKDILHFQKKKKKKIKLKKKKGYRVTTSRDNGRKSLPE